MADNWITRKTLLLRAVDSNDNSTWSEFVDYYGRFIYHIILKMGVNSSNADDLAQQILLQLWRKLETYDSTKGRFRPWLSTVIRNAANKHLSQEATRVRRRNEQAQTLIHETPSELDKMIENEWENHLTQQALTGVRKVFSGKAIDVFLMSLEGISQQDIALKLDIALASVKVLKARVKACFVSEMKRLIRTMER